MDDIRLINEELEVVVNPAKGNLISSIKYNDREKVYIDIDNFKSQERPRCGIPIMFPYFGIPSNNELKINDRSYPVGIHGLIHSKPWIIIDYNQTFIESLLVSDENSKISYPFDFRITERLTLTKNKILFEFSIINDSFESMPCDLGLHPFFLINDFNKLMIETNGVEYIDPFDNAVQSTIRNECILNKGLFVKNAKFISVKDVNQKVKLTNIKGFEHFMIWTGNKDKFLVVEPLTSYLDGINQKNTGMFIKANENIDLKLEMEFINN